MPQGVISARMLVPAGGEQDPWPFLNPGKGRQSEFTGHFWARRLSRTTTAQVTAATILGHGAGERLGPSASIALNYCSVVVLTTVPADRSRSARSSTLSKRKVIDWARPLWEGRKSRLAATVARPFRLFRLLRLLRILYERGPSERAKRWPGGG